jgi:hypothetical protein
MKGLRISILFRQPAVHVAAINTAAFIASSVVLFPLTEVHRQADDAGCTTAIGISALLPSPFKAASVLSLPPGDVGGKRPSPVFNTPIRVAPVMKAPLHQAAVVRGTLSEASSSGNSQVYTPSTPCSALRIPSFYLPSGIVSPVDNCHNWSSVIYMDVLNKSIYYQDSYDGKIFQ